MDVYTQLPWFPCVFIDDPEIVCALIAIGSGDTDCVASGTSGLKVFSGF